MTDKEIIQTLEKCSSSNCDDCYYCNAGIPCLNLYRQALNLINRQQEEIERLTDRNKRLGEGVGLLLNNENGIELIRVEAIKEFAEKLKEKTAFYEGWGYITVKKIDNLVKEMVGAE